MHPNLPVFAGVDGGATPAAIFGQKDPDGRMLVIAELVVFVHEDEKKILEKMGPNQFGETYRRFVDENFPEAVMADPWGDPAVFTGDYAHEEDRSWADEFSKAANVRLRPAPVKGNLFSVRKENIVKRLVRDNLPYCGMLLSPDCPWLRQGFNNGYTLPKSKLPTIRRSRAMSSSRASTPPSTGCGRTRSGRCRWAWPVVRSS